MTSNDNKAGAWARWALGIGIVILVGVLTALGTCAMSDRAVLSQHGADIQTLKDRLERMEGKIDRLLERTR